MIGGTIIDIVDLATKMYINVIDENCHIVNKCAIYIERNENSLKMKIGDSVWWQDDYVMWTPKASIDRYNNEHFVECGVDYDIKIPRIGYIGLDKSKVDE